MNRTDTKFVTCKEKLVELLRLAQGKYYAQVIDGSKVANYMTTYWDTDDHHFYLEHHNGRAPRQKVRVRTYLDSNVSYLEVKTKNNHGRTKKKRVEVPTQDITGENGNEEFLQGLVHRGMNDIHPTVRNRFHRITLVNYGKTERLTMSSRRKCFQSRAGDFAPAAHPAFGLQQVLHRQRDDEPPTEA